jgi:hypothetical protein
MNQDDDGLLWLNDISAMADRGLRFLVEHVRRLFPKVALMPE